MNDEQAAEMQAIVEAQAPLREAPPRVVRCERCNAPVEVPHRHFDPVIGCENCPTE